MIPLPDKNTRNGLSHKECTCILHKSKKCKQITLASKSKHRGQRVIEPHENLVAVADCLDTLDSTQALQVQLVKELQRDKTTN